MPIYASHLEMLGFVCALLKTHPLLCLHTQANLCKRQALGAQILQTIMGMNFSPSPHVLLVLCKTSPVVKHRLA